MTRRMKMRGECHFRAGEADVHDFHDPGGQYFMRVSILSAGGKDRRLLAEFWELDKPKPEQTPEPKPKLPLNGYAVFLNNGERYNIVADDWVDDCDEDGMLNFYLGNEFAATFRYTDIRCFIRAWVGG